jgi:hypothetical protein
VRPVRSGIRLGHSIVAVSDWAVSNRFSLLEFISYDE